MHADNIYIYTYKICMYVDILIHATIHDPTSTYKI